MEEREVSELLDSIDKLRLTLTADLSAAAAAIEEDRPRVARDIVAADRLAVRQLCADASRSSRRQPGTRRRRALLALPAVPLIGALAMTGAAALSVHHAGQVSTAGAHNHADAGTTAAPVAQQTATSTLRQLEQLVSDRHQEAQVVAVADQLHDELSAIIAASPGSTQRINEVRHLLAIEQRVLEGRDGPGEAIALAASRRLTALLATTHLTTPLTSTTPVSTASAAPTSTTKPTSIAIPKPSHSTTPTTHVSAAPTPSQSPKHRHHHKLPNPLLGPGLFNHNL